MNKKKIMRIVATVMTCASLGVFAVSGCAKKNTEDTPTTTESVSVDGVALNKNTLLLKAGEQSVLAANVSPDGATNKNVIWSSDNTAVATVDCGLVTAVAAGTATITVTTADGNYTAICAVTVEAADPDTVPVTGVTLDKTTATLKIGGTTSVTLAATVAPANATNTAVTWNSDNTAVATVNNGVVTAVASGTATITVTTADGGHTATCAVTVEAADPDTVPVTGVTLDKTTATLKIGGTTSVTLAATVAPANATNTAVSWSSDNTAVATVNNGVVTAVAAGNVTITVTTADGNYTATCAVTVQAADQPTPEDYTPNGTYTLDLNGPDSGIYTSTIVGSDSGYQETYFKLSSSSSVGTDYLYANLKLQAGKIIKVSGKAQTSNKTDNSKSVTLGISLKSGSVGTVTGLPSTQTFNQADGVKAFEYSYTVTAAGTVVLQFNRTTGSTGCDISELVIEITDPAPVSVESVSLDKTTSALKVGESEKLTATVLPADADNTAVTWSSSNTAVASVDQEGNVTALKAGSATITVTTADGNKTATCEYTVTNVAMTGISFTNTSTAIAIGDKITLTPVFAPVNATIKTVTWKSSDEAIATVADGVVTGVSTGTAQITVTSADGGFTATCTVEVLAEIIKVQSVSFAATTGTLNTETEEKTLQLNPIINPAEATNKNVSWKSSDSTVASVDENGLVTAHKKSGTAVITVTTEDGEKTATFTLTVEGPQVTANTPVISKYSIDELETAYVEWTVAETEGVWFNVYYKAETDSGWTKLDGPLVRQYTDYYRADMVGLKAGTYAIKVVPVVNDAEVNGIEAIANGITVKPHDRSGYAFYDGACPGAYNPDGTLKSGAIVLYITNDNLRTLTLTTGRGERVGLHSILGEGYLAKSGDTNPLCIRLIGNVIDNTDLDIKGLTTQGVTVEGIGNDATLNGWGVHITRSSNVEIRNLGFMNTVGSTLDNIGSESGCTYLWIHNNDMFYGGAGGDTDQAKGDGALDSKGTDYATYSYNHFWDSGKSNLLGNSTTEEGTDFEGGRTHLSYHHNWYDHSDSRHPRIRSATVHVYNNYFDGNAKYGVGVTRGASAFVEANYFRSTAKMKPMMSSLQGTDIAEGTANATFSSEPGGIIKSFNNKIVGSDVRLVTYQQDRVEFDCYEAASRDEQVPSTVTTKVGGNTYNNFDTSANFKTLYSATVDTPDDAKANCERYAGRIDGSDFKWEFDDETEDGNSNLIKELKEALVAYKSTIVKIGS